MANTNRVRRCPKCKHYYDSQKRYRLCDQCALNGRGGPRVEGKVAEAEGWLYFICESGHAQYVKIGFTKYDPEIRVRQLQTGNPRKLVLMYATLVPAVAELEARLHETFAEDRVEGEWFKLSRSLREYIFNLRRFDKFEQPFS